MSNLMLKRRNLQSEQGGQSPRPQMIAKPKLRRNPRREIKMMQKTSLRNPKRRTKKTRPRCPIVTRRSCCYATSVLTYVNQSCSNLGPLASDLPLFNHFKCFYWVWLSVGAVVCPTVLNPLSESSAAIIGGAQSTIEEGSGGEKDIALALTADNQPVIHTIGIHGFLFKFIHDIFLRG